MKTVILVLAGLVFSNYAWADDAPHLALWITDSIHVINENQCNLSKSGAAFPMLPDTHPTLTERDVTAWNAKNAHWSLNSSRFPRDSRMDLADHCFILAVEGKYLSSGVVLNSNSARLIQFSTLKVYMVNQGLDLHLTADSRLRDSPSIHADIIGKILSTDASNKQAK